MISWEDRITYGSLLDVQLATYVVLIAYLTFNDQYIPVYMHKADLLQLWHQWGGYWLRAPGVHTLFVGTKNWISVNHYAPTHQSVFPSSTVAGNGQWIVVAASCLYNPYYPDNMENVLPFEQVYLNTNERIYVFSHAQRDNHAGSRRLS